ncbi:MAG: hypothetical protein Q4B81_01510 [Moraxella sp.]|nr:hypothetical protein [Moraxella sp.]
MKGIVNITKAHARLRMVATIIIMQLYILTMNCLRVYLGSSSAVLHKGAWQFWLVAMLTMLPLSLMVSFYAKKYLNKQNQHRIDAIAKYVWLVIPVFLLLLYCLDRVLLNGWQFP